jgi:hypothetical protein
MEVKYLAGYEPASITEAKALCHALARHYNVLLEEEITLSNFNRTFYLVEQREPGSFSSSYRLILGNRRVGVAPYKNLNEFLAHVKQIAQKSFPGPRYTSAEDVAQEVRETYHTAMQLATPLGNSVPQERLRIKVDGSINPSWHFEQQLAYLERIKEAASRMSNFEMKFIPVSELAEQYNDSAIASALALHVKADSAKTVNEEEILIQNRLKRKYK